jgi:hypothetical protein
MSELFPPYKRPDSERNTEDEIAEANSELHWQEREAADGQAQDAESQEPPQEQN